MRKVLALILAMALVANMAAQTRHMVSLGIRGGASSLLEQTTSELQSQFGPAGGIDLHYDYLTGNDRYMAGLRTGVGIGLSRSAIGGRLDDQFARVDYLGNTIRYTLEGQVSAPSRGLTVSVPLMATLRAGGFYGAIGAKAMYHSYTRRDTRIRDVHIHAYYPIYDVTLTDELITGRAPGEHLISPSGNTAWSGLGVSLAAEIGYEWRMTIGRYQYWQMGAMAYIDCALWNQYSPTTATNTQWFDVLPISDPSNPPAEVQFYDAYNGQVTSVRPMEVGVKLTVSWVYEDMRNHLPRRPRMQQSNLRYKPFKRVHRN